MIDWLNDNSGAVQAISVGVLAVVTAIYAWRTWSISNATEKQAEASRAMADEMREQRLLTMRPIVLLSPLADETEPGTGQEMIRLALKGPLPDTTPVRLTNIGPAIAVGMRVPHKLSGEGPRERVIQYLLTGSCEMESHFYLRPGEHSEHRRLLRIDYCDVFGNCFESIREFHKEPNSNHYVFTPMVHREVAK